MKNVKKLIIPAALAVAMSLSAFLVACGGDPGSEDAWRDQSIWLSKEPLVPTNEAELPEDIAYRTPAGKVHDPSVFHDPVSDLYYAYGTHYAVASTYDFADAFKTTNEGGWKQLATDTNFKVLFGNETYGEWPLALRETVDLVKPNSDVTTTWAPDVEYLGGKYYMYYSLTKAFGSNESAIGRVESDSPEGPFGNNTIIIDSMGANRSTDPNCIDPELFYDKDGKLWMVYGSDMGGIFIKELHADGENIGLPIRTKAEEGFGKKLWSGGKNQEGPFIFYNASTGYYYLMTSHARLQSNYNMHVARSLNPDGPYVGIDGKNVAENGDGNLVAGNFRTGTTGLAAMGHNSVVKDKDGKYFVIYHSRTISTSGSVGQDHRLYVSQMYFNEEGWPVMAATPYVGETRGTFAETQVTSSYDIIVHAAPSDSSSGESYKASFVTSSAYTLTADGKVTGTGAQSNDGWTLKDGYYIEITLKGVTYKGVVAPGWDIYSSSANQKGVVTITAVSDAGISLWAIQK